MVVHAKVFAYGHERIFCFFVFKAKADTFVGTFHPPIDFTSFGDARGLRA
jgi:hypothetical protein